MPHFSNRAYDSGLGVLDTEATNIEICSAEPTTYTQAITTFNLGTKSFGAGGVFGAPAAGTPSGRSVTSVAVTDGTISVAGTASHWAITDRTNSRLLAAGSLASPKVVTVGIPWTMPAMVINIPGPA